MKDTDDELILTPPQSYREYLRRHGRHFTKGLCEFAIGMMMGQNGEKVKALSKREVDHLLASADVTVEHAALYDTVFVANMGLADYLADSIPDMEHLARYVKNVIDDPDGYDGIAFGRWFADMCNKHIEVKWNDFI